MSACVCVCVVLFPLLLRIKWTQSFFQVSSHLLGHPVHLGLQDWVPGPDDSALGSDFASPSLLLGPGEQELPQSHIHRPGRIRVGDSSLGDSSPRVIKGSELQRRRGEHA